MIVFIFASYDIEDNAKYMGIIMILRIQQLFSKDNECGKLTEISLLSLNRMDKKLIYIYQILLMQKPDSCDLVSVFAC